MYSTTVYFTINNGRKRNQTVVGGLLMFFGVFIMQLNFKTLFKKKNISNKMFEKESNKDIINNAVEESDSNE